MPKFDDPITQNSLFSSLVTKQLLDYDVMSKAYNDAKNNNCNIIKHLADNALVDTQQLCNLISNDFGLPIVDIETLEPTLLPHHLIDEKYLSQYRILPLIQKENYLYVGVADPNQQFELNEIEFSTGLKVRCLIVDSNKLDKYINKVINSSHFQVLEDCISETDNKIEDEEEINSIDDAPMVKFVHNILLEAIEQGASDIHFEPYDHDYRVRFRIDGVLYETSHPPMKLSNRISSRLKIMSLLDISERRIPQDGRCKIQLSQNDAIDFRISTCPTVNGEKLVLRILDAKNTTLGVDKLGFNPHQKELFLNALNKPQGMILVTGPTGSGKTVTLYSALNILNSSQKNISTAEDPVEIKVEGINQVQINSKIGLTFAKALRSFLRQDPDIIMVGEIRDLETAEIAIKAAQTGHMVLSTLHTNSAPETINRLLNMGVQNFNIANTLSLILAQRLARKLCPKCKRPLKLTNKLIKNYGLTDNILKDHTTIYQPVGCKHCANGYKGRIGLFEVLSVNDAIANLIIENASIRTIIDESRKYDFITIYQSGLEKLVQGLTSIEEIHRVTVS